MSEEKTYGKADIAGARKDDTGKSPIYKGGLAYFPKAIAGVASVSNFGATKYAWNGWRHVDNGVDRYTDAMVRHLAAEAQGEILDPESGLPHTWHVAWGALARAELMHYELVKALEEKNGLDSRSARWLEVRVSRTT